MPYSKINDPTLWRERAAEARAIAALITDAGAKEKMLAMAKAYEEMAERAEQRALTDKS